VEVKGVSGWVAAAVTSPPPGRRADLVVRLRRR